MKNNEYLYLDHAASTPMREVAFEVYKETESVAYANSAGGHALSRMAKNILEESRDSIASHFGAAPREVTFTSGGTEADNWIIKMPFISDPNGIIWTSGATEAASLMMHNKRLNCSDIEHECVKSHGISNLIVNSDGIVEKADEFVLQGANSETGICQGENIKGAVMSDQVQTFGKLPISFNWLGIKSALLSAHKIGGPKGVGALVLSDGIDVSTQIKGGGQEEQEQLMYQASQVYLQL